MTSAKGLYIDPPTNKWRIGKELGSGACGSVHELLKSSNHDSTNSTKTFFVVKVVPNVISNTKKKRKKTIAEKNSDLLCHENTLYNNVLNGERAGSQRSCFLVFLFQSHGSSFHFICFNYFRFEREHDS